VKSEFAAAMLRCPECGHDRTMRMFAVDEDDREIRTGTLACTDCGAQRPVYRGVANMMLQAPEHVEREAAGLKRFADTMRAGGWTRETILGLPNVEDGYWYVQGASINQLLHEIPFAPGQSLLDIGSNTCWASNYFAVRGLKVVALDISLWEMQGLWTADYFIEDGTSYFERVLGSMDAMPIASSSLDYVYACEVLHHNDSEGLHRTFEEAYRVLKPGGRMLVVNETLKTLRDPVGVHAEAVEAFEGYEHAHWAWEYRWAATRAGFRTRLIEPSYHRYFAEPAAGHSPPLRSYRDRVTHELRSRALGRKALLAWINHAAGDVAFGMVATKPAGRLSQLTEPLAQGARAIRGPRPRAARSG
jgi:SAM-dependent methyltransferase